MIIPPHWVELARSFRSDVSRVEYRVAVLSEPLPDFPRQFDVVISNLVIEHVEHFRGFIDTISASLKPGGRFLLSMTNPYSAVYRGKVPDYFESGAVGGYVGLKQAGIDVAYHHRTFEDYVRSFRERSLFLEAVIDPPRPHGEPDEVPFFVILDMTFRPLDDS